MTVEAVLSSNWQAYLSLKLQRAAHKTLLVPQKRQGPLSVQRPFYPESECCHVYLLHPPGGVVGGDQLHLEVHAEQDSSALLTAPGATKFYTSASDTARFKQSLYLESGASLEFLPHENIYFPGARVEALTQVTVQPGARLIFWEKQCYGRPANQEAFLQGFVRSRIEFSDSNGLLFADTQRVDHNVINSASGMRGFPVIGSCLIYDEQLCPDQEQQIREIKPVHGIAAVTRVQPALLVVRFIGSSTLALQRYFIALWQKLRPQILQRPAEVPRIWNT